MKLSFLLFLILISFGTSCNSGQIELRVARYTGSNGSEETFYIYRGSGTSGTKLYTQQYMGSNDAYTYTFCTSPGTFTIYMRDSGIDGWSYGSYLYLYANDVLVDQFHLYSGISSTETVVISPPSNFRYPQSSYSPTYHSYFEIEPSFNGEVTDFSIYSGYLPSGLSLSSSSGVIYGRIESIQSCSVTIKASNKYGFVTFTLSFDVIGPPSGLSYDEDFYILSVGEYFSIYPDYNGEITSFSVYSGSLPAGLSLNQNTGRISGYPTTTTSYKQVSIKGSNDAGWDTCYISFSIYVKPSSLSYPNPTYIIPINVPFSITPSYIGSSCGFYIDSGSLPSGLTLDIDTGEISGTPTQCVEDQLVTIRLSNSVGEITTTITFTILPSSTQLPTQLPTQSPTQTPTQSPTQTTTQLPTQSSTQTPTQPIVDYSIVTFTISVPVIIVDHVDSVFTLMKDIFATLLNIDSSMIQITLVPISARRLSDQYEVNVDVVVPSNKAVQVAENIPNILPEATTQLKSKAPSIFSENYNMILSEQPIIKDIPTDIPIEPTETPIEPTEAPTIPIESTEAPVVPTEAPIISTEAPIEPTEAPIKPTDTPIEPTDTPIIPTEAPVVPTKAPVEPTKAPIEPTEAPIKPTDTPIKPTDTPIKPTDTPIIPTEAPVVPTKAPVEPTEAPIISTDTPTIPTGIPVEPTDSPVVPADFECNVKGYKTYLSMWTEEQKASSRDPESEEFQKRFKFFIESCRRIKEFNTRNKYQMEFTYYADWSADEFEALTNTVQRYSGIKPEILDLNPVFNNSNYRHLLPSLDPCDDVIEGGNTLRTTISKPQNCSVSWAFAVTNSIEYAIKKLYLDKFDQAVEVALSAQELIDCVGKEHDIENSCQGIPIAWGFDYAFENGIAFRKYYPHTNVAGECKEIIKDHKYHITSYEKPHEYNKYGVFELLKKGPVAVALGLNPSNFQFYENDRDDGSYFTNAYNRPSIYGVAIEYHQYEMNDSEVLAEWPYFAIETRLRACDSMIFRLPIYDSVVNSNIAGIAGFAIRPIVEELLPNDINPSTTVY